MLTIYVVRKKPRRKIYNVSCERYLGFGYEVDEETANKNGRVVTITTSVGNHLGPVIFMLWLIINLEKSSDAGLPSVLFVLPNSYVDPKHKDYGSNYHIHLLIVLNCLSEVDLNVF